MKRINITLFAIMLLAILFSCTRTNLSYTQSGNWVSRATFQGIAVGAGASFVVNNVAYVGTGIDPLTPNQKLTTMFEYTAANIPGTPYGYDSAYGSWTSITNFPGQPRSNAVGFTIGGTGYIGGGLANDGFTPLNDYYAYTPGGGWRQIDSLVDQYGDSHPRYDAVSFSFDTTAYVLTGTDNYNYFNDIYRYSPTTNTWIALPAMPGSKRSGAITWMYNNRGYLVTGFTNGSKWASGTSCYDFWYFTPLSDTATNSWQRLHDIFNTNAATFDDGYTNIIRQHGVGFVELATTNGDCAYITLGSVNGGDVTFTWEYNFAQDLWNEKTPYEGTARTGAVGFSLSSQQGPNRRGFVATGLNQGSTAAFSDCEEFFPNQVYNQYD
ncbi:MAG TPA: kelch repeat-containing protein [Puia sp.]|jgi:N-acetylneuraminic acid mutarotase|nr:kelch repeat-containing protein [Puia sp.]